MLGGRRAQGRRGSAPRRPAGRQAGAERREDVVVSDAGTQVCAGPRAAKACRQAGDKLEGSAAVASSASCREAWQRERRRCPPARVPPPAAQHPPACPPSCSTLPTASAGGAPAAAAAPRAGPTAPLPPGGRRRAPRRADRLPPSGALTSPGPAAAPHHKQSHLQEGLEGSKGTEQWRGAMAAGTLRGTTDMTRPSSGTASYVPSAQSDGGSCIARD